VDHDLGLRTIAGAFAALPGLVPAGPTEAVAG
jgi:hypothetical protein